MTDAPKTNLSALTGEAASTVGGVAAGLRADATRTFELTVVEVRSQANDAKVNVAQDIKDLAAALRRACEDLHGGSAQERTLGQIAGALAAVSDTLRDKDLGEILTSANRAARDNSLLFLGGVVFLGFATSRNAKVTSTGSGVDDNQGNAFAFVRNLKPQPSQPQRTST